jgi:short-subunit dehydrogenase
MVKNDLLNKKNCFITGATGSLGRSFVKKFAQEGCNLFLTGTNNKKLAELKEELKLITNNNIKISYESGNLEIDNEVENILKKARADLGDFDILVNNAGVTHFKPFTKTTISDFDKMFDINVRATYLLSIDLCRDMIKKGWGRIINVGSTTAYKSLRDLPLYSASKHAVLGLSKAMYQELVDYNVKVYIVNPGALKSEMGKFVVENFKEDWDTFIDTDEVADYVIYTIKYDDTMINDDIRLNRVKEKFN